MDPGIVGAWIGAGSAAAIAVVGGSIRWALTRVSNIKAAHQAEDAKRDLEHEAKVKELTRKIEQLEQAADRQEDVIVELRSQRDRLMVTAEIQDKFFNQLPQRRTGDSG